MNFSPSKEDLQDLRFSQRVVEDSRVLGCDTVLLGVSWCSAGTCSYMSRRYIGVLVNMGRATKITDGQSAEERWTGYGCMLGP